MPVLNWADDVLRFDVCWTSGIHYGEYRGDSHGGIKQAKQRECGQVGFAGLDVIMVLDLHSLLIEVFVTVMDTFRWSGAPSCEDNRCRITWVGLKTLEIIERRPAKLVSSRTSPKPTATDGDVGFSQREFMTHHNPQCLG